MTSPLRRRLSGTSPAAPGVAVLGVAESLLACASMSVHVQLQGATGGTLTIALQREIVADVWSDWVVFPQLAAGAPAIEYSAVLLPLPRGLPRRAAAAGSTITLARGGSAASPVISAAPGSLLQGHPGERVRLVALAGTGTTAGATQIVFLIGSY